MTLIGKLMAFLNLVVGLGILTVSVSTKVLRPTWDEAIPEGVSAGQTPENFKQMAQEIESLTSSARIANANTRTQRTILEALEGKRQERLLKYEERLEWARKGNPKNMDGAGFFEPVRDKDTGLLVLDSPGEVVMGPDGKPLKGSDNLLNNLLTDVKEVASFCEKIVKSRKEFEVISKQILGTEIQLLKMTEIREAVQSELFYLSSFEVNVYETRETVLRRKKQLDVRLMELRK